MSYCSSIQVVQDSQSFKERFFHLLPEPRSVFTRVGRALDLCQGFEHLKLLGRQVARRDDDDANDQIAGESVRCLSCDARKFDVILNTDYCKECGYCEEVCGVGTFGAADFFNSKGYRPEEVKSSDCCVGCFKCYFVCPDFAIDVREVTG